MSCKIPLTLLLNEVFLKKITLIYFGNLLKTYKVRNMQPTCLSKKNKDSFTNILKYKIIFFTKIVFKPF